MAQRNKPRFRHLALFFALVLFSMGLIYWGNERIRTVSNREYIHLANLAKPLHVQGENLFKSAVTELKEVEEDFKSRVVGTKKVLAEALGSQDWKEKFWRRVGEFGLELNKVAQEAGNMSTTIDLENGIEVQMEEEDDGTPWVPKKEDELKEMKIRNIPTEPVEKGFLDLEMSNPSQAVILHEVYKRGIRGATVSETCDNGNAICPTFGECLNSDKTVVVAQCEVPGLIDQISHGQPPLNRMPHGEKEMQLPWEGNVFVLKNVYVNSYGTIFNSTHSFFAGGCQPPQQDSSFSYTKKTALRKYTFLAHILAWHGGFYFYSMSEALPDLMLMESILQKFPRIPVLMESGQKRDEAIFQEVGHPLKSMNVQWITRGVDEIVFAENLVVPAKAWCAHPSKGVLRLLKTKYLRAPLPPARPSDFNPDSTLWEVGGRDDWVIIVAIRPENKRMKGSRALADQLIAVYGKDRVVVTYGVLPIPQARELYPRAVLLVGEHNEGLTHMTFMTPGTALYEIRPNQYDNRCYHYMADRLRILYYLSFGTGRQKGPIEYNVEDIAKQVEKILPLSKLPSKIRTKVLEDDPESFEIEEKLAQVAKKELFGDAIIGVDENEPEGQVSLKHSPLEPIQTSFLTAPVTVGELAVVVLQKSYSKLHPNSPVADSCEGGPMECPLIAKCQNQGTAVALGVCHVEGLSDEVSLGTKPLNMADIKRAEREPRRAYEGNVYVLENVYLNAFGVAFNSTHQFYVGGCRPAPGAVDMAYTRNTRVTRFATLVSLISLHGGLYYHSIVETLPNFLLFDSILKNNKGLPVAMESWQKNDAVLMNAIGWTQKTLNPYYLSRAKDQIAFAERLLVASQPRCGRPTASVLNQLRKKFFEVDFGEVPLRAEPLWKRPHPKDWVIIVSCQRGSKNQEPFYTELVKHYGTDRVVSYYGNATISESRTLFARALVLVGEHHGGLTNILYMAPGTALVEIRPEKYDNRAFHYLADQLSIDFYLFFGEGRPRKDLTIDINNVVQQVLTILPPLEVA